MTPDRREELRRCDDACYRTRTSREIDDLKERIKALESLLIDCDDEFMNILCFGEAPNALKLQKRIMAILPKTEEVK